MYTRTSPLKKIGFSVILSHRHRINLKETPMIFKKVEAMLLYLWQLPQHLLGLLVVLLTGARFYQEYHCAKVFLTGLPMGVSLGKYIIVYHHPEALDMVPHEWGHTRQSRMLGPLYLLLVGFPSITMNIFSHLQVMEMGRYYHRWPENWADHLGGVERTAG